MLSRSLKSNQILAKSLPLDIVATKKKKKRKEAKELSGGDVDEGRGRRH